MDLGAYKPRPWPVYFARHRNDLGLGCESPTCPAGHPPGRPGQGLGAGRPALDHGRPLRGVVPGGPDRAGRATSVPFTAVLTGPQRTATDDTMAAITCPSSPHPQVSTLPDLALQAGGQVEACIGLAVPIRSLVRGPERRRRARPTGPDLGPCWVRGAPGLQGQTRSPAVTAAKRNHRSMSLRLKQQAQGQLVDQIAVPKVGSRPSFSRVVTRSQG
jgi:hypothetical protein